MKLYLESITNNFYIDFAQYVGANIALDFVRYENELSKYKTHYTCYRYWQEIDEQTTLDFINGKIKSIPIKQRKYYACTRKIENIQKMIEEEEIIDSGLISKHEGGGISVLDVLRSAMSVIKDKDDLRYMKEVYIHNQHQDEILFVDPIVQLDHENVEAYYNEKEEMIVPL